VELSSRLEFSLEKLGYEFPRYPVPGGGSQNEFLRAQAMQGARERYRSLSERVLQQLEKELKLIENLDLAGYFLIVWDMIRFCREQGILVQGRGSAANSAVCSRRHGFAVLALSFRRTRRVAGHRSRSAQRR
jgi:error-prone DNA polymerase